jgi:hypothetical protein
MKKAKLLLTGIAVLAIVGSAFAFKASNYFSSGSVFCSSTCAAAQLVAFKVDCSGSTTPNPCAGHVQTLPYYMDANCACQPTISGATKFVTTTDAGN